MNSSAAFGKSTGRSVSRRRRTANVTENGIRTVGSPWARFEVVALIVIAVLLILGALSTGGTPAARPSLSHLKVRAGDSLWTLAATHPVAGMTTAQVADLLAKANRLDDAGLIIPGETILVPATSLDQRVAGR